MSSVVEEDERNELQKNPARGRWLEDVINPARRSGRMSWMLIGCATSLAFELRLLDESEQNNSNLMNTSAQGIQQQNRIRRLLHLYSEQLSLRMGLRSMTPQALSHRVFLGRGNLSMLPAEEQAWQICVSGWMELSRLVKSASDMLFPSTAFTTEILQSGRYVSLISHFQPLLSAWHDKYGTACGKS